MAVALTPSTLYVGLSGILQVKWIILVNDTKGSLRRIYCVVFFYIFLTVLHLDVILVNDQLDALFLNVFISTPLHVSNSKCSSSGGPTCINTPSGITHSGG